MSAVTARQLAVALAAVQQIAAPSLIFAGVNVGNALRGGAPPSPAEPAGYAFAIWGVIYIGCLAYALHQALPRNRDDPDLARIAPFTIALFLGSTAWLLVARDGPRWATLPIIVAMLVCALAAMLRLARPTRPLSRATKLAAGWPLALYAGWLSAATCVNVATVLPAYGITPLGLGTDGRALAAIALAGAGGAAVTWASRGALPYALAVVWALGAIMVRNLGGPAPALWAATGAAVLVLLTLLAARRVRA